MSAAGQAAADSRVLKVNNFFLKNQYICNWRKSFQPKNVLKWTIQLGFFPSHMNFNNTHTCRFSDCQKAFHKGMGISED